MSFDTEAARLQEHRPAIIASADPDAADTHVVETMQQPEDDPEAGSTLDGGAVPYFTTAMAAALSAAGAAWLVTGIFRDPLAHAVALAGVALGIATVLVSYRLARAGGLEYAVIPLSMLLGAILLAPDARGSSTLPSLVVDAIKAGGLLQPPISFDPGWRFILVVVFSPLAATAASVATGSGRPKLAVFIPMPLTMGAALIQPGETEILNAAVALALTVSGLAVAYGAELSGQGKLGAGFETRRLARSAGLALGLVVAVLILTRAGFLFPQPNRDRSVPPQKPQVPPSEPDRVLFTATLSRTQGVPIRLGVIDFYDTADSSWKLPPYDAKRFNRIQPPARLPGIKVDPEAPITGTIRVGDAHGHALPSLGGMSSVRGTREVIDYDPRTETIRTADKPVFPGLTYSVAAAPLPTGKQLASARPPEKRLPGSYVDDEFLRAPPPPTEVLTLLSQYSQNAAKLNLPENRWDRLISVRQGLYDKVVAAGPGNPVDLPASRVAQMLSGGEASPYEITAAEALLARWAGVPSRIGYGYYGGTKNKAGALEIHPRDGATFLEVYFRGYGWIPVVGVPPKAKPSTSTKPKKEQNIIQSNELALVVYIPVEYQTVRLLYEYVRYFLVRSAPFLAAFALLVVSYPWFLKMIRVKLRRRWARARTHSERIAVAYAEFRDRMRDLTIGDPSATPVEFIRFLVEDGEHRELAWLVSRALWGDLRRDLRTEDAEAAESLATSLTRRTARAQPAINRILAAVARTSLREPFSREIPNLWIARKNRGAIKRRYRKLRKDLSRARRLRTRRSALVAGVTSVVVLISGCGQVSVEHRNLPLSLVPASIGNITFQREPKAEAAFTHSGREALVSSGLVYSVRHDDIIEGSVQVALFKADKVSTGDMADDMTDYCVDNPQECPGHQVFKGIQRSLGTSRFQRTYFSNQRAYVMQLDDQRIYLWFPPKTNTEALLILRKQFTVESSDLLFQALITYQMGRVPNPVPIPTPVFTNPLPSPNPGAGGGNAFPAESSSPGPGATRVASPTVTP